MLSRLGSMSRMGAAFRRILKPRNFGTGLMVAGGLVCAQTAYLQSTYVPLGPPIRGVMHGLERCSIDGESAERKKFPQWVKGLVNRVSEEAPSVITEKLLSPETTTTPVEVKTKRVLIIGDSLVVGIGCKDKPVLPQAICGQLAELLDVDVAWRALGVNGGDVRTIHKQVLAAVDEVQHKDLQSHAEESNLTSISADSSVLAEIPRPDNVIAEPSPMLQPKIDAVIVLCGLNDFKRLWMGRTSTVFRRDLDKFLVELRQKVGEDCIIVLPAIPLEETLLPEPLKTFAIWLSRVFDEEKRDKAAREALTHFIPKPAIEIWSKAKEAGHTIVARDGVHPNERGYAAFGEYLAAEMAQIMSPLAMQRAQPA